MNPNGGFLRSYDAHLFETSCNRAGDNFVLTAG
jgi:hypothetical protein